METVTRTADRQVCAVLAASTPGPEVARTLLVTAIYLLSEDGRKASLLAGGDGHAVQQITLQVTANRLHLVSVDKQGVARLKLRPRFERDEERGLVRIDAAPLYDAPPTIDELYRAAAKNHELETVYHAERVAQRSRRSDDDRTRRETVAEAFLADKGQRAVAHPPPSPKRCYVITDHGRLLFDITADQGIAKEVPPEAHRRFRADLRVKAERVHVPTDRPRKKLRLPPAPPKSHRQNRTEQLALHEEKKRFIAEWIAANGTDEQKTRQAAGVLPMAEAIEGITDQAFAVNGQVPVYTRDGADRLQTFLRQSTGTSDLVVSPSDVAVRSVHAVKATATQWAVVRGLQSLVPDATVVLREHVLSLKRHLDSASLTVFGVLVTKRHGPFVLRRDTWLTTRSRQQSTLEQMRDSCV